MSTKMRVGRFMRRRAPWTNAWSDNGLGPVCRAVASSPLGRSPVARAKASAGSSATRVAERSPASMRTVASGRLRWRDWRALQQCTDRIHKLQVVKGLVEPNVRTQHGRNLDEVHVAHATATRHDDDLHFWSLAAQFHDQANAFLLRHDDVGQNNIRVDLPEFSQAVDAVDSGHDTETVVLQHDRAGLPDRDVVFNYQHSWQHRGRTSVRSEGRSRHGADRKS